MIGVSVLRIDRSHVFFYVFIRFQRLAHFLLLSLIVDDKIIYIDVIVCLYRHIVVNHFDNDLLSDIFARIDHNPMHAVIKSGDAVSVISPPDELIPFRIAHRDVALFRIRAGADQKADFSVPFQLERLACQRPPEDAVLFSAVQEKLALFIERIALFVLGLYIDATIGKRISLHRPAVQGSPLESPVCKRVFVGALGRTTGKHKNCRQGKSCRFSLAMIIFHKIPHR